MLTGALDESQCYGGTDIIIESLVEVQSTLCMFINKVSGGHGRRSELCTYRVSSTHMQE